MSELDALARLAALGTAHSPRPEGLSGLEGEVVRALGSLPLERQLLLAAGVLSVARAAGRRLEQLAQAPEAALPEALAACPPRVSAALAQALRLGDDDVVREAFERMARAGRCLPPEMLPRVLGERSLRAAAEPVLGERGRWLAQHNPAWRSRAPAEGLPEAEGERLWAEGTAEERRTVLAEARSRDPARARTWLRATWAQEKAEQRADFLACLAMGLSAEDEELLELGRKDRAASVREVARRLLTRLPGSAFSRRMAERARAAVAWEQRSGATQGPLLRVQLPNQWDAEAERDGLDKPPPGVGRSEHWLQRLLGAVPLQAWEEWLAAPPESLLAAAQETDHAVALSLGWAEACRLGGATRWAPALLSFWARCKPEQLDAERVESLAASVLEHLPPAERAAHALQVMKGRERLPSLERALAATPGPWPVELGRAWLTLLQGMRMDEVRPLDGAVLATLRHASLALPAECLGAAAEPVELPLSLSRWSSELQRFQDTVALRRTLHEELKP